MRYEFVHANRQEIIRRCQDDVCQSIRKLAMELDVPINSEDFRALNACLDDAIAQAVTQYGHERNQQAGFFSHELRNLLNTAILAFEVLNSGKVGIGGSTGNVLHRSLLSAYDLVSRSLNEIRLKKTLPSRQEFSVADFIDELAPAAALSANARHIKLKVMPAERGIRVEADREVLAAVMMNLLQNAFKFTRPRTTVTLRVKAGTDRVLFEVEDECGGLPSGNLFRPFEQRSTDRTGVGLGLAFSRSAVNAHDGRLYARSLPGVGCVFTVELPRVRL
jgi:signal transduction histidine kinase